MAQQTIDIGSAPNDGTGDPIRDAFDKCNDNFTELYGSLAGLLDFQGATDCSASPNYPAASQGDIYIVSVAGKIGGASGKVVEVGDFYLALADNAGGTEASVGTSWAVLQANITGGIGAGVDVEDEGVSETAGATILNFTGAGVTASDAGGGQVDINIPGGGGISGIDVEDEGVSEATGATILNFTGAGVTATDAGGGQVDIAIPGGGSGGPSAIGTTNTISGGYLEITGLTLGTYCELKIVLEDLTAASDFRPKVEFHTASGWGGATDYKYYQRSGASSPNTDSEGSTNSGTDAVKLGDGTNADWQTDSAHACSATVVVINPGGTTHMKKGQWDYLSGQGNSGAFIWAEGGFRFDPTAAIDGVRVTGVGVALTAGQMTLIAQPRS